VDYKLCRKNKNKNYFIIISNFSNFAMDTMDRKKYYQHSYPYPDGSKKRGRRTKEEQEEYIKSQQLKVIKKITILTFD
tara:strand:+ start:2248 stop:2481 length:234 start_codon:yes stop_codon:yes gene_type:complete